MNNLETDPAGRVIYKNEIEFREKLEKIRNDGHEKIHFLMDYDGTVTHEWSTKGVPRLPLISILRSGNYLSENYVKEAQALADYYRKNEKNPNYSFEQRKALMQEWWEKHYDVLTKHRLNVKDIHQVINDENIRIRSGMRDVLIFASNKKIPVIIMSANGLGKEAIVWNLQNSGLYFPNIQVVSNDLIWDEVGYMKGYKKPIVHSLNKDETVFEELPEVMKLIEGRSNVIQMGDSLGDLGMVKGLKHDTVLSIGFYNEKTSERLQEFTDNFDLVLTGDAAADDLQDLLRGLV